MPVPGKRGYGTGELYEKHGSYYGRWRTSDGRKLNRKVGPVRSPGSSDGLTRAKAERAFRNMQEAEERRPSRRRDVEAVTVSAAAVSLLQAKALEGARKSYLENLDSMQRIHLEPSIGKLPLERVSTDRIEALASEMLASGRSRQDGAQRPDLHLLGVRARDREGMVRARTRYDTPRARNVVAPATPAPTCTS